MGSVQSKALNFRNFFKRKFNECTCTTGREKNPDAGINCVHTVDKPSRTYAEIVYYFRTLANDKFLQTNKIQMSL